eukprot:gene33571-40612_t
MVSDAAAEEEKAYALRIVYMLYLGEVQSMPSGTEIGSELAPEDHHAAEDDQSLLRASPHHQQTIGNLFTRAGK